MNSKYSNKIEINRKKLIYNKNKSDLNENNNYFLNGVHLELPNFQENNYQNQFINRKLFTTNSKKKKSKYNFNFDCYDNEKNKIQGISNLNNYYSNNSKIPKNIENYLDDSLTENFENLKKMNSNINNILSNMKKEIQSTNKKKIEEIQKSEEDINFYKFSNTNDLKMNNNELNQFDNLSKEINNENNFNYFDESQKNKKENIINISKKQFIIDSNQENHINIQGIKQQNAPMNIKFNEFNKEQENKLKEIYGKSINSIINVEKLINDLYEYKIKCERIELILKSENIEKTKKEINENLTKLKEENKKLNLQKRFLINELTKSIYNRESLRQKYKNELDRFDSYINKIKYDLKEKVIEG